MSRATIITTVSIVAFLVVSGGLLGGCPAYLRYQTRQEAYNTVLVSSIEIQNQEQRVEIEKQKAEIRVQEAKGIAESQRIIASSLDDNYLQYLAIQAQKEMAHGENHTEVYIPSGPNGIPLVRTINEEPHKKVEK